MTIKNTPEERQLITLIGKLPVEDSDKASWVEQIQTNGMSQDLATLIHDKLAAHAKNDPSPAGKARLVLDFSRLVNRWRLASQKKTFKR
ncbi:MAG TPA: hypothetical protein VFF78_01500 [Anaerolineaceae bacterium]|nr:hypothetical protein [Anaerolineaceae bacterium]